MRHVIIHRRPLLVDLLAQLLEFTRQSLLALRILKIYHHDVAAQSCGGGSLSGGSVSPCSEW